MAMRRYLANLNAIDAKLCIGMGLLGLEDLLDGDRAERVSAAALSLSERRLKGQEANLGRTAWTAKSAACTACTACAVI